MTKHDLVRPSRDGDQFHYHWASRQCLGLLPGSGDLVAVTIEGASTVEGPESVDEGEELIDIGLYYGSEEFNAARFVRYIQLKHSTLHAQKAWTASGLEKTIRGFAQRYASLRKHYSASELRQRVRFEFTTNRPIESQLHEALVDLAGHVADRHPARREALVKLTQLNEPDAVDFFQVFLAEGGEPDLWAQRNLLAQDLNMYLAEADYDCPVQLKELVTRKATTEFQSDPSIRRYDVLRALKVAETELLPSPCQIVAPPDLLPREQEGEVCQALFTAKYPVIIHADGGVGKSILALRLAQSLPSGSESILYDCFGDGLYRNALHFRHRHRDALVQISNELASRGLCHPLIPSSNADAKQYLRAFCGRLSQAIDLLHARDPQAILCLIVDAADNADMAAEEQGEASFVRDLIRTPLPNGVQIAFTCRTHRRHRLGASPETHEIELRPFSESETALHLRTAYPDASDAQAAEFAFLSSSNPRVQALAIERRLPLEDMLRELGPTPSTVDRAIGELLQRAVDRLKDRVGGTESKQIDLICQALAVLRPLVPIPVLARISGTQESEVRSFALDLGRPLFIKGNSLHFLDEPAETWFRERFHPDPSHLTHFVNRLKPLASQSSYVASTLPQLLLAAGRMDELVELALSADNLPIRNPLERRDVEIQRLTFALRACLQQGRFTAAAKLALKAGGECAGESRHTELIQRNTDLAGALLSPDRIDELVSRRTFGSTWMGSHHAYDAGLLSGRSEFAPEAAGRLRMAMDWLYSWARRPEDERHDERVDRADMAELAMAHLRLQGAKQAVRFLSEWKPRHIAFESSKLLARRLIDLGQYEQVDSLSIEAGNNVWILLGLAVEAATIQHSLPAGPLSRLLRLLADRRVRLEEPTEWNSRWDVLDAVRSAINLALRTLPQEATTWSAILRRYLPETPPSVMSDRFGADRTPLLRAYALEAALRGHQLVLIDLAPPDVRAQLEAKGQYGRSQETESYVREVSGLLPWYLLSADIACGRPSVDLSARIKAAIQATADAESRDYQRYFNLRQAVAIEWVSILQADSVNRSRHIAAFRAWMASKEEPLWPDTLTSMSRTAARADGLSNLALEFAAITYDSLEKSREDAESRASSYQRLARAIFPTSLLEAAAYFNRAVEISSRIGDENLSRWSALLHLAKAAGRDEHPRPRSAYRLSRAAELTYEYVARDKHFDWNETVEALTDLCGSSALAILSRWRDRQFGRPGRLLPIAVKRLIDAGTLPTWTPLVFFGLAADWDKLADLKRVVEEDGELQWQRSALQAAYRYMRIEEYDDKTWTELSALGNRFDLDLLDVQRLLTASRRSKAAQSEETDRTTRFQTNTARRDPDWPRFFDGVDMTDAGALRRAYSDLRTYDVPYKLGEFFQEALKRVPIGALPTFVNAVAAWSDFGIFELRYLLDALPQLPKMISLNEALREATLAVCRREPESAPRRARGSYFPFKRLCAEGIVSDEDVVAATLEGYSSQVDTLSAEGFFHLMDPLASCLSSNEAEEALSFGLGLLDDVLQPEDGDGPWRDNLLPPASSTEALAGYVWAGLGSPIVAKRWEFAHVVRTSVELGWTDLLSTLAKHATSNSAAPFVDEGLVFYEWHARQWLLIGLARGALDQPATVAPLISFLKTSAREEHVLIRAFAAQTLQSLQLAGIVTAQETEGLDAINQTELALEVYSGWHEPTPDDAPSHESELSSEEKYYFGIDIGPYWFAPLGRAFGVSEAGIEQRARQVLRERLATSFAKGRHDARYKRKMFEGSETSHSHGSMPQTDDLRAYHSYHAMMIVAARLLGTRSVRKNADESKDEFQDWLEGYLLSRSDKRWLADRRDPRLVTAPPEPQAYGNGTWCWSVTKQYLDQQLLTDDGLQVLWGQWSSGNRNDNETVSVRSALVSRSGSGALLAALQTTPRADGYFLPSANLTEARAVGHLRLRGWVQSEHRVARADEEDPWAAKLEYPAPRPCPSTIEKLALTVSADERRWTFEREGLLRSESWTRQAGYGQEEERVSGTRLAGDLGFIKRLLDMHPQHLLILSVSVRRLPPRDGPAKDIFEPYPWPYMCYYLIDKDGRPHSL
ncbi:AVAST type 3 anti-phage nuclease/ATPase Avs3a [Variovorax atrisoli]|uniref:AVAST type 3 anti-phage nuclease/ATPase Avs3a n=1 Tax=Variovorax atrisoli TaxID=3394203 RepID=UPI003396F443